MIISFQTFTKMLSSVTFWFLASFWSEVGVEVEPVNNIDFHCWYFLFLVVLVLAQFRHNLKRVSEITQDSVFRDYVGVMQWFSCGTLIDSLIEEVKGKRNKKYKNI